MKLPPRQIDPAKANKLGSHLIFNEDGTPKPEKLYTAYEYEWAWVHGYNEALRDVAELNKEEESEDADTNNN